MLEFWTGLKRGENIGEVVAILMGFIVATLSIIGIVAVSSEAQISAILAASLSLVAGLLWMKYKIENLSHHGLETADYIKSELIAIKHKIASLDLHAVQDVANTVKFSTQVLSSRTNELENANEVWMLGLALKGTIQNNFYTFKNNLSEVTKLRILMVNWKKVDIDSVVEQFAPEKSRDDFVRGFEETVGRLRKLSQFAKNKEDVKLGLLNFVPPFSIYVFPKAGGRGVIYVEMYCYKSTDGSIPKFQITERDNPVWYKHFSNQFDRMWNDAEEYSL